MGREVYSLEVFRKTPSIREVCECLRKQFAQHHNRILAAQRNEQPVPALPAVMWLLSSGQPRWRVRARRSDPQQEFERAGYRIVMRSRLDEAADLQKMPEER